jgi:hypothetical protein
MSKEFVATGLLATQDAARIIRAKDFSPADSNSK